MTRNPAAEEMVSIHARHYWRASQQDLDRDLPKMQFQSTPAITGERARIADAQRIADAEFQSTPAITGERAVQNTVAAPRASSFNPRPPLLASEPFHLLRGTSLIIVSIHARHYWRASRRHGMHGVPPFQFQSTPAITGERAPSRARVTEP